MQFICYTGASTSRAIDHRAAVEVYARLGLRRVQLLHEELVGCVVDLNVLFTMREDDCLRVSGYGRGADDVAGVMIFVWNLRRGPATAVAKILVVHTHLVLEQTQRRVHHLGHADEPELPLIE